jgi:hypothetical protein
MGEEARIPPDLGFRQHHLALDPLLVAAELSRAANPPSLPAGFLG